VEKPCKVVTAEQMREIDQITTQKFGMRGTMLMENAGGACTDEIEQFVQHQNSFKGKIKIFCGTGNNGGDGFVIGRYLANRGYEIEQYLIGTMSRLNGDAKEHALIFLNYGNKLIELDDESKIDHITINQDDIIVDAILGNGIKGAITGAILNVVGKINASGAKVIAIDIPTGLPTDFPHLIGDAIKATLTLTIGLPKISEVLYQTKKWVGELKIVDIGFPKDLLLSKEIKTNLISKTDVVQYFPKRRQDGHKGDMGNVAIVAGSVGMTGAAILSARAAFLSGPGFVKLGIPQSLNEIAEKNLIEILTFPLAQTSEQSLSIHAYDGIKKMSKDSSSLLIGPGLSLNIETKQLVKKIIGECHLPLVVDADGLNILSENIAILENNHRPIILTPHIGEMSRLIKKSKEEILNDPIKYATSFAKKWKAIIVLKSASTIVADPEGNIWVNVLGNDGMAKAGSGDILAGLIAGFWAQGVEGIQAAIIGTWIHSMAGDLASVKKGKNAMMATDILDAIPEAIKTTLA